jgi:hypothetical protein
MGVEMGAGRDPTDTPVKLGPLCGTSPGRRSPQPKLSGCFRLEYESINILRNVDSPDTASYTTRREASSSQL